MGSFWGDQREVIAVIPDVDLEDSGTGQADQNLGSAAAGNVDQAGEFSNGDFPMAFQELE
jgi:hypothetical protein